MSGPSFIPHPVAEEKKTQERSDKSESLAVECMKLAVDHHKGQAIQATPRELVDTAELIWLWTTTDTWPKPAGAP